MGHPNLENKTPFHFEPLFLADEELKPLFVGIMKATFRIQSQEFGPVIPMRDQIPLLLEGENYGDPEVNSYRYEPECTPYKLNTDIVLIGTAKAPGENLTQFDCGFRVGNNMKVARIFGNRQWLRKVAGMAITPPEVVTEVPLTYENAFGGWDKTVELNEGHPYEERNPVGKGYHHKKGEWSEGSELPNIEDPENLISGYYDTPNPIGFGFTSPHWLPRKQFAGTFDEAWTKDRAPKLPQDFNPLYHNAGSDKLIASGFLNGDEPVQVLNASPWPKLVFQLPGLTPPLIQLTLKNGAQHTLDSCFDTLIVNTDDMLLHLYYRSRCPLTNGAHDVENIEVSMAGVEAPTTLQSA